MSFRVGRLSSESHVSVVVKAVAFTATTFSESFWGISIKLVMAPKKQHLANKISPHVTIVIEFFVDKLFVARVVEELNVRRLHFPSVHRKGVQRAQPTDWIGFQPDCGRWSLVLRLIHGI